MGECKYVKNTQIKTIKPETKTRRYTDRDGLTLEVRPSGRKIFIFRFQWNKKPQTITLGCYPGLPLIEARNLASAYRAKVDNNVDPRAAMRDELPDFINVNVSNGDWIFECEYLYGKQLFIILSSAIKNGSLFGMRNVDNWLQTK